MTASMFANAIPAGAYIPAGMTTAAPIPPPPPVRPVAVAAVGYYQNHSADTPARLISVLELAEMAANPSIVQHPHIAAFTQHNGNAKTKGPSEAAQFAMIVMDHDDDDKSEAEIRQLYGALGVRYLAFTTSSHMLSKNKLGKPVTPSNKWKVVVPLAQAVDAQTFHQISAGIAQSLCTDFAQTNPTQIAYRPNKLAAYAPYISITDQLGNPPEWLNPNGNSEFLKQARAGWIEYQQQKKVEEKAPVKQRTVSAGNDDGNARIVGLMLQHYDGQMRAILNNRDYKGSRKLLAPGSSSGAAAVNIMERDGKEVVFSHHGPESDKLSHHNHNGHALDAADVICTLDFGGDFSAMIKHYAKELDGKADAERKAAVAKELAAEKTRLLFNANDLVRLGNTQQDTASNSEFDLPPLPDELKSLPDGLGAIQAYIYGTMTYPCLATAGWAAIATFTAFAQTNVTIDSRQGLGLNEFYLTLAKTGFGKEALRYPLNKLAELCKHDTAAANLPNIESAAPSSKQGLHQQLEANNSVYIQSDEFAEWLKHAIKDVHKAAALAYAMEIYNRAFGTVHPGGAVTNKYDPVANPRLSVFATTTAESVLSSMTLAHAEMGAYNRFVIYVAPEHMPEKKYTGLQFEPSKAAIDAVSYAANLKTTKLKITPAGFAAFIEHDQSYAEPIKFKDALMGGRISEQAMKLAGLFALSAKRNEINADDMRLAYKIRLGLYHRASVMVEQSGAISGAHETTKALDQVRTLVQKNSAKGNATYISQLKKSSRAYAALHINEQYAVIRTLIAQGDAAYHPDNQKLLIAIK